MDQSPNLPASEFPPLESNIEVNEVLKKHCSFISYLYFIICTKVTFWFHNLQMTTKFVDTISQIWFYHRPMVLPSTFA